MLLQERFHNRDHQAIRFVLEEQRSAAFFLRSCVPLSITSTPSSSSPSPQAEISMFLDVMYKNSTTLSTKYIPPHKRVKSTPSRSSTRPSSRRLKNPCRYNAKTCAAYIPPHKRPSDQLNGRVPPRKNVCTARPLWNWPNGDMDCYSVEKLWEVTKDNQTHQVTIKTFQRPEWKRVRPYFFHGGSKTDFSVVMKRWRSYEPYKRTHERIMNVDLSYPILVSPDGDICDGMHRMARLIIDGKTEMTVRYVTVEQMDGAFIGAPEVKTFRGGTSSTQNPWRKKKR